MLKEKYNKYKEIYTEYLIFIKSGNFYLVLNNDAIVMNTIFKYKIKESTNFIKVGFPITSLEKILSKLDEIKVNYLVVDQDIVVKQKFKNNIYKNYYKKLDNYEILINRINKIYDILKNNLNNKNIKLIIEEIEDSLCKINY